MEDCADVRALTAAVPPPEDPTTRAKDGAGDYKGAEALTREALAVASQGREPVLMSRTLRYLATVLSKRHSRNAEALETAERALAIRQKAPGPEHPDVASVLINVGNALHGPR